MSEQITAPPSRPAPSEEQMKRAFAPTRSRQLPTHLARTKRSAPRAAETGAPEQGSATPVRPRATTSVPEADRTAAEDAVRPAVTELVIAPPAAAQPATAVSAEAEEGTGSSVPTDASNAGEGGGRVLVTSEVVAAPSAARTPSTPTTQRPAGGAAPRQASTKPRAGTPKAASVTAGSSSTAPRTVSKLLVSTHQRLTSARAATGRTNTALVLLAIDHHARDLGRLVGASRTSRSGSLFEDLPREVERRVRVSLDFTAAQLRVIDDLVKQHGTTRQELIDVSVAAEYDMTSS